MIFRNALTLGNGITSAPAVFIGSTGTDTIYSAGETIRLTLPTGSAAGDLIISYSDWNRTSSGQTFLEGTWLDHRVFVGQYYYSTVAHRILTGADITRGYISTNNNNSGSPNVISVYRNATTAAYRSYAATYNNDSTITLAGQTKIPTSKGFIAFISDRDPGGSAFGLPASWTSRAFYTGFAHFDVRVADINAATYVNGTAVTFTGMNDAANDLGQSGFLLELS